MLPVNCGSHADYQNFVVTNLRKYYPDPNALARSTWDIIERFWNLDLSFTDSYVYFLRSFLRPRIIFTFQSSMPEFYWHDHSRFREIIL